MSARFNATGVGGRDCPVCFRAGSLKADLVDERRLTCLGCATKFTFLAPRTLERITPPAARECGIGAPLSKADPALVQDDDRR